MATLVDLEKPSAPPSKQKRIRKNGSIRMYPAEDMFKAFYAVKEEGISIRAASRRYKVPERTLGDRVAGKIPLESTVSGPLPVFTDRQEWKLVCFFNERIKRGLGCSKKEVLEVANAYALQLNKRPKAKPLRKNWFYGFMNRNKSFQISNPGFNLFQLNKPGKLEFHRRKDVAAYFNDFNNILETYGLKSSPERIFCVYEIMLTSHFYEPLQDDEDFLPSRNVTTLIGCGNAVGNHLPPYFVFEGDAYTCQHDSYIDSASLGAQGTVTQSGLSSVQVFKMYLQDHFLKYARHPSEPLLVIYDGSKSRATSDVIDWAKKENIELFMIPTNTSHFLHPMDDNMCFRRLHALFNQRKNKLLMSQQDRLLSMDELCEMSSDDYLTVMKPGVLHNGFKKTGIVPYTGLRGTDPTVFVHSWDCQDTQMNIKHENCEDVQRLQKSDTYQVGNIQSEVLDVQKMQNTIKKENILHVEKENIIVDTYDIDESYVSEKQCNGKVVDQEVSHQMRGNENQKNVWKEMSSPAKNEVKTKKRQCETNKENCPAKIRSNMRYKIKMNLEQ